MKIRTQNKKRTYKVIIWPVFLLLLIFYSCSPTKNSAEISNLRCEYLSNLLGIDVSSPRLSWVMKSESRGAAQIVYRIIAASDETFDITSALKSGENAFGIILGNGWYIQADRPNDTMLWYDTPRLIAQFEIEYEDGTKEIIVSDEGWKSDASPILYNGLHTGEIYDARLEQKGWNEAGFNDSKWQNDV